MKLPASRPWLLALITLGVALVPIWFAWNRFREESRRKDAQIFEATSGLAGERIQLVLVRHLHVFGILRNQLRPQAVPSPESVRIPPAFNRAFPHLRGFGYAAIRDGGTVLEWLGPDGMPPFAPGTNLDSDARLREVMQRAERVPVPSAGLDPTNGSSLFVACAVGDGPKPRGFVVGWLDVTSLCRDSGIALIADRILTAKPLVEGVAAAPDERVFEIHESDLRMRIAIGRGPMFRHTYGQVSPSLVLGVGTVCAVLLAFLVFQGTRAMQLRSALEAERLRARLVQGFSHEFRTPLSVILSSVDLLSAYPGKLDPSRRGEVIGRIHDSARRMVEMVDEILLLNRLESARVPLRKTRIDLSAICGAIGREIAVATGERNPIEVEAEGGVDTDPTLLRGLLANLLSNAVKYSPPGAVVRLETERRDGVVLLTVRDEGIGIPADDLPRIGEAFHRASNVGDVAGTGLGLAIVRRSASLLGGSFTIESEEGKGTAATLILPVA